MPIRNNPFLRSGPQPASIAFGKTGAAPKDVRLDRRRVLKELAALVSRLSPRVRERVLAEIRPVFASLAQQSNETPAPRPRSIQVRCDPPNTGL